jgi:hypothetical protein
MITPWPKTPLKHIPETRVNAEGLGARIGMAENFSYWPIKLVFGNCKYVNFHRYRDFEKIVEDIDLSRIVGRMEGLSIDPATAAS